MSNSFLRSLLPASVIRWRRRQIMRRQVAELQSLTYPATGFAEMFRRSRDTGNFATQQVESEIVRLLELVHQKQCQTLLEIGTAGGGTLYLLTRAASRHATFVSLDIARDPDHWNAVRSFAQLQQRIVGVTGNSNAAEVRDKVIAELAGRPLDFLLIDGDHSSYGVRRDFELYSPLVAAGGMIAFHDICLAGGVQEFWPEVRAKYCHEEFVGNPTQTECGIGLLHV